MSLLELDLDDAGARAVVEDALFEAGEPYAGMRFVMALRAQPGAVAEGLIDDETIHDAIRRRGLA